jgi:antitoxin (DNA-binding transcriptional repressor) of toxin-antitoxin stability system
MSLAAQPAAGTGDPFRGEESDNMILCMSARVRRVTVTEAARNFADLVNRAFYRHETTVLIKNGVAVAHIGPASPTGIPASEALARWRMRPRLTPAEAAEMDRDITTGRRALPAVRPPWD